MSSFQQLPEALDPSIRAILDISNTARCSIYCKVQHEKAHITYHKPLTGQAKRDPQCDEGLLFQSASLFKVLIATSLILIIDKLSLDPSTSARYRALKDAWNRPFTDVFNRLVETQDQWTQPLPGDPSVQQLLLHYNGVYDLNHILLAPDGTPLQDLHDVKRISQYANDIHKQQGEGNDQIRYSNTNYILLALLIDKASGSLNEFLTEYIFKPFGMNHTFLSLEDLHSHLNKSQRQPHVVSSDGRRHIFRPSTTLSSSNIVEIAWLGPYVSAANLARFFEGLLLALDGKPIGLIDKKVVESLGSGRSRINSQMGYTPCGLHTSLNSTGPGSHSLNRLISPESSVKTHVLGRTSSGEDISAFYLAGSATGWANTVYFLPNKRTFVIVLTNTSGPLDASDFISRLFLQDIFDLQPPKAISLEVSNYLPSRSTITPSERYRAYYVDLARQIFDENALKLKELEQNDIESDISDIESIFSAESLLSSQSSQNEISSIAVSELASLLLHDNELMLLYPIAISKVGYNRFHRNFARFLKRYGQSLEREAFNESQHQAAHFVLISAYRIAVEMERVLRQDGGGVLESWKMELEVPKAAQVNKWLELQKGDRKKQHEIHSDAGTGAMAPTEDEELSDGSDSAESESYEQNSLHTLDGVKEFMVSAQALLSLRQEFRAWLKVEDPNKRIKTQGMVEVQEDYITLIPYIAEFQVPRRAFILKIIDALQKFRRPAPFPGYKRITWQSAYGKPLYMDVKETCKGGAEHLQNRLRKSATLAERTESYSSSALSARGEPRLPAPAHIRRNPSKPDDWRDSNIQNPGQRQTGPAITDDSCTSRFNTEQDKRYLLLCFSTRNSKSFRQIDVTDSANDQYLFQRIHDVYWEIKSAESWVSHLRLPKSLKLPSWVRWCFDGVHFFIPKRADFISFTLMPIRQDIRPYGIKPSLPPEDEVRKQNWHYCPCPTLIEHFHMDEAFITQLLEPGHAFLDNAWSELFPKKLKSEFRYEYQKTGIGWGIHIVEDLNPLAVAWVSLLIFLTSGALGILYSLAAHDVGAGFTIAAWFAGTAVLSVTCLQLSSEKTK